jgi:probable F420-dependent oxidoreductase
MPSYEMFATCARAVEQAGWDGVWVTDHPFPVVTAGHHGHHAWDPLAALAFVAAITERVALHANLVVLPYRNPFVVAKSAATVQHLSGGRLALSLGAGYLRPEFDALGADFDRREQLLVEGVDAMLSAWSGEPVMASGDGWNAAGNTMLPAARPRWLLRGGNGRSAVRHAARAFDAWAPFEATPATAEQTHTTPLGAAGGLASRMSLLRDEAAAAGRAVPEVWLTRSFEDCLQRPRAEVLAEIAQLEDLGVAWLAVWLGSLQELSLEDYVRRLDRLAALVR